jgi:phospholipid/cholesterol/gamma-HCH transport system substrate-binding protein
MSQETKLGFFVLLGVIAIAVSILLLGDFRFQRSYELHILFNDISGLPDKARVKIAGVEVGGVNNIALEDSKARVSIWIRNDVKIHRGARASIVSTGIIGYKYIELTTGDPDQPLLQNNDLLIGTEAPSLEKMAERVLEQVESLAASIKQIDFKRIGDDVAITVANLRDVSDALRTALADNDQKLTRIVNNIDSFTGDLAQITGENKAAVKQTIDNINTIVGRVEKGEGVLGSLVNNEQVGEDVQSMIADLKVTAKEAKRILRRINLIETYWDYNMRYDSRDNLYRHDVGLRVFPQPDRFYYVGVSNAGTRPPGVIDPEENNTGNLLIGQQFGPAQIYAGVIRSSGGFGTRVRPLWKWNPWRRLEVVAEAYDFFRVDPVAKPRINMGARVEVTPWAYVGAQYEDPYAHSSWNATFNLVLRDENIAYILGLIGLAR